MKKNLPVLLFVFALTTLVQAHEFWLQPMKYFYSAGEMALINFKVGENFMGEPWDLKHHKIQRLELIHGSQISDLKDSVREGDRDNLDVELMENGTHLI